MNVSQETTLQECEICGNLHFYEVCNYVPITDRIPDTVVPPRAKLSLPNCLELKKLADESYSIFARETINKGTQFGPLRAKKQFTLNPSIKFPVKLFSKNDFDVTEYYLDTSDENECNWMIFVNAASFLEEQNLICYQVNEDIYYASICDIMPGDNLKVWYSPFYASKMKKNILSSNRTNINSELKQTEVDINELVKKQHKILPREIWNCKFCYALEKDVVKFAEHLLKHYRSLLQHVCDICKDRFIYKKSLEKHIDCAHRTQSSNLTTFYKPITKLFESNDSKYRLIKPKDTSLGGPLLMNNVISDSLDNSSCMLQQSELSNFDIENQNILLDTDNLLSVDVLNEKSIENYNFDINELIQEHRTCDLCLKPFGTLKSLVRHLEQHTGKYICQICSKVFCRKEGLLQHGCSAYPQVNCSYCPKIFNTKKLLTKHVKRIHQKEHNCKKCNKIFSDRYYLSKHNCVKVSDEEKPKFICHICHKEFFLGKYLKEHLKIHQTQEPWLLICHICSKSLIGRKSYVEHLKLHDEPAFSCDLCNKKFHQYESLSKHKNTVHSSEEFQICDICSASCKTKIALIKHKATHKNKTFDCSSCSLKFKSKSNLSRHIRRCHTPKKYNECDYVCPICQKKMKLRSSYKRHLRNMHPMDYNSVFLKEQKRKQKRKEDNAIHESLDLDKSIDTDQKCLDLKETIDKMNFTTDINECHESDDINLENILNDGTETIDRFLKETSKEITISDITRNSEMIVDTFLKETTTKINEMAPVCDAATDREVQLSVPDLTETDAEIKLGRNAYILENGTIVEPQENPSNVVVYLLNEASVPLKNIVDDIV